MGSISRRSFAVAGISALLALTLAGCGSNAVSSSAASSGAASNAASASSTAAVMVYWASQYINPDLYKDIDVDQKTTEFFKEFYGYDLSKAELDTIFHR